MAILLLEQARFHQARSFYRDIYNGNDKFYMAASRADTWTDDTSPDTFYDNRLDVQQFRDTILFVKRVQSADTAMLAKRIDWATGELYTIIMMIIILPVILPIPALHHCRLQTFMY